MNDYIAIGAIEELKNKGYKIPQDISLIGMDDMYLSMEINPPLTTIKINMEEIGKASVSKLISIIKNKYQGKRKTIIKNRYVKTIHYHLCFIKWRLWIRA